MTVHPRYPTVLAAVDAAASQGTAVHFVRDDESVERLTYAELRSRSLAVAAALRQRGVAVGARVPVILPTSPEFLATFYGLMIAGAIPCPISMPAGFGSIEGFAHRLTATTRYLGAKTIVASAELCEPIRQGLPGVDVVAPTDLAPPPGTTDDAALRPPSYGRIGADHPAFIQCTSGSTGSPKGVVLAHANLVANCEQIARALTVRSDDAMVSWLPLNHDMGIIGGVLMPLYTGIDTTLLSPGRFQRRPASWLRAISRFKGAISPAPNFAYAYVTARAKDEELEGVDLSTWRHPLCGAEPIDYRTLHAFQRRFEKYGLRKNAVHPCYGLAEASLAVTFHGAERPLAFDRVKARELASGVAVPAGEDDAEAVAVVNCGPPVDGAAIRVAGRDGEDLAEGHVGRIWVKSPSVMRGYFELPDVTAETLRDGWLDTGDLGYVLGGELRVTGRAKDMVIIRGKKYRPAEFEWAAERAAGVRPGTAVAFGVFSEEQGTELLYLVCETDKPKEEHDALRTAVSTAVLERTGIRPDVVRVTRRGAVPKTTSGKLQRNRTKDLVLGGRDSQSWRLP